MRNRAVSWLKRLTYIGVGSEPNFRLSGDIGYGNVAVLDMKTGIVYVGEFNGGSGCLADDVQRAIENGTVPNA